MTLLAEKGGQVCFVSVGSKDKPANQRQVAIDTKLVAPNGTSLGPWAQKDRRIGSSFAAGTQYLIHLVMSHQAEVQEEGERFFDSDTFCTDVNV
jgi:hypothetical protein